MISKIAFSKDLKITLLLHARRKIQSKIHFYGPYIDLLRNKIITDYCISFDVFGIPILTRELS